MAQEKGDTWYVALVERLLCDRDVARRLTETESHSASSGQQEDPYQNTKSAGRMENCSAKGGSIERSCLILCWPNINHLSWCNGNIGACQAQNPLIMHAPAPSSILGEREKIFCSSARCKFFCFSARLLCQHGTEFFASSDSRGHGSASCTG